MPWPYAQQAGIVKKWADKYGIKINLVQVNDYVESVNQYTAGKFDGVTVTNMDALTIPAAGGKDTTAIIVGDYSNGNDGILLKGANSLSAHQGAAGVPGRAVGIALPAGPRAGKGGAEVHRRQDRQHVRRRYRRAFSAADVTAAVAWNPQLSVMKAEPGVNMVFSSADIPGEILDLMVVDTATLEGQPQPRQGAGRHLVRNRGADAAARMPRARKRAPRWPSCRVRRRKCSTASWRPPSSMPIPRPPSPQPPRPHSSPTMTAGARFQLLQGPVQGRSIGRRGRHRLPRRQDAGRSGPRDACASTTAS